MSRSITLLTLFSISIFACANANAQSGAVTASPLQSAHGTSISADSANTTGNQTVRLTGNDGRFPVGEIPAENLSELLSGRFAGVQVVNNGATGTASRIRIRGQSSLLLSNDPLIVVDGVRLAPSSNTNASLPSRTDDINIEDIASIEILGGPSATTFYGTGAANGVINITTRRGSPGRTRVRAYTENGLVSDPHDYPDLWSLWGKRSGASVSTICTLALVSAGTCAVDSLSHGNVLNIDSLTPIAMGYRSQYGFQVSGGAQRLQYFLSGEREDETGVFKMPARDIARLEAERGVSSLPGSQVRPSALTHNSARINFSVQPASFVSASLSSAYVSGETRLVTTGEQSTGLGYNTTGGLWRLDLRDSDGVPLAGYTLYTAGDILSQMNTENVDHYLNTLTANFAPLRWLEANVQGAFDNIRQRDNTLIQRGQGPAGATRLGYVSGSRHALSQTTLDVGATAAFTPATWLNTRTSIGWQRTRTHDDADSATAFDLPAGATSPGAGAAYSSTSSMPETRFTALYLQQVFSLRDNVTVSGGVRRDVPVFTSGDGEPVYLPTVSVSWDVFGHSGAAGNLSNALRIYSSYGVSSRAPNLYENFVANFATILNTSPGGIKPERLAEIEGGVDVRVFGGYSTLGITAYTNTTRDALIPRDLVPSLGDLSGVYQNTGRIKNDGVELTINQQLATNRNFAANVSLTGSANRNRLTKLPDGVPPIVSGNRSTQRNRVGYPLFGLWSQTYTYSDADHDGIITARELVVSDTAQFIASSFPTRALALSPAIELLNHKLRLAGQIDSKWGFKKFNNTLRHQCGNVLSCRGLYDKTAPLATQAAAVAVTQGFLAGMLEDGSFTRFREASAEYQLPGRWAHALRATAWNVVVTARNLGVSTNYSGADPESVVGTNDTRSDEFFSTPPMRYYTLRLNFTF